MASLKTITGTFTGPDGNGIACQVKAVLSQACTVPGTQEVIQNAARVFSNPSGVFSLSLYANNDLTPTSTSYTVTAVGNVDGTSVVGTWTIVVPQTAGPFEISNLLAVPPPVPSPPGALDSQVVHLANPETITGVKVFQVGPGFGAAPPAALAAIAGLMGNVAILPPPRGGNLDDSANLQGIIDALSAAGGGEAWGWGQYRANLVLKQGVLLRGPMPGKRVPFTSPKLLIRNFAGSGYVIDTPAGFTSDCGVMGVGLEGQGAGGGVRFQNVKYGVIQGYTGDNFADEGLKVMAASLACQIDAVFVQNGLQNQVRGAPIGAVDIDGNDHFISNIEATIGASGLSTSFPFCASIVIRAGGSECRGLLGAFADVGIKVIGSSNQFHACRAQLNWGHGWSVAGGSNQFAVCQGANNSKSAVNTYDNWLFETTAGNNVDVGCSAIDTSTSAKYGFEDATTSGSANRHVVPLAINNGTAQYINTGTTPGWFQFASGNHQLLTANSATPAVTGGLRWQTNSSIATTITNFTGGVHGQEIFILATDGNTTIQHNGAGISLPTGANKLLVASTVYSLIAFGNQWRGALNF